MAGIDFGGRFGGDREFTHILPDLDHRRREFAHRVRQEHSQAELATSKDELMDILAEVIDELESERVSQSEFEHFSFTWQAVDALVRDQFTLAGIAVEAPSREVSA